MCILRLTPASWKQPPKNGLRNQIYCWAIVQLTDLPSPFVHLLGARAWADPEVKALPRKVK